MAKSIDDLYNLIESYLAGGGPGGSPSGGYRGTVSVKTGDELKEELNERAEVLGKVKETMTLQEQINDLERERTKNHKELTGLIGKEVENWEDYTKLAQYAADAQDEINRLLDDGKKTEADLTKEQREQLKNQRRKIRLIEKELSLQDEKLKKEQRFNEEGRTAFDEFEDRVSRTTKPVKKGINEIKSGVKTIGKAINEMVGPWRNISQAAADFARSVGTSGRAMEALRKKNIESVTSGKLGIRFGLSPEELTKLQQTYTNQIGRNVGTSFVGDARLGAMNRVFGENTTMEMISSLDNYGVSLEETGNRAGKMFANAAKHGVSLEKVSKTFAENIKRAQGYTFKNGLRDLEAMARKSAEMRLDLSQVFAMADKVSTVEGAITTGANLQVLGGPFAQMGNPLGMLYEGLNDPNALMDRMIKMFGNLGSFNKRTGEVEVSAFNKQRIKAAAQASGLDYGAVMESVNAQARRGEIGRQISGMGLSKEVEELIKNTGVIQNGVAGVNYKGKFYTANDIKAGKLSENEMLSMAQSESENIEDIATTLRGWNDIITGAKKQKEATQSNIVEKTIGKFVQGIHNWFGNATGILNIVAGGSMLIKVGLIVGGVFEISKGVARIFGLLSRRRVSGGGGLFGSTKHSPETLARYDRIHGTNLSGRAKFLKGVGGRALPGLAISGAGLALGAARRSMVENGTMEANSTGDIAMRSVSTAAQLGGGIGMMFGPAVGGIATGVGALVGLVTGILGAVKQQNKDNIESKLGVKLSGNYTGGEMGRLSSIADDGHISSHEFSRLSKSTKKKLIESGDAEKMGIGKYTWEKDLLKGYARGGTIDNTLIAVTPGEAVMTRGAVARHHGILSKFNQESGGNPIVPGYANGGTIAPRQVYDSPKVAPSLNSIAPNYWQPQDANMDVNFKGTIKVEFPDGTYESIGSELLKDSAFKKNIANYAVETMNREQHAGQYRVNKGFRRS